MSDPPVSGTNYAAVKGLLDLFGDEGWSYLEQLDANIPFYGQRGKDPQEKTVSIRHCLTLTVPLFAV